MCCRREIYVIWIYVGMAYLTASLAIQPSQNITCNTCGHGLDYIPWSASCNVSPPPPSALHIFNRIVSVCSVNTVHISHLFSTRPLIFYILWVYSSCITTNSQLITSIIVNTLDSGGKHKLLNIKNYQNNIYYSYTNDQFVTWMRN